MSARAELSSISRKRVRRSGSVVEWRMFMGSGRLDGETRDPLEVPAVIGQQREAMAQGGRADQEIKVRDAQAGGSRDPVMRES